MDDKITRERQKRKAAELGIALETARELADRAGVSVDDLLRRIDSSEATSEYVSGSSWEELEESAPGVREQRRQADRERDRSGRVRVSGYEISERGTYLVPKPEHNPGPEMRPLTSEERQMLDDISMYVAHTLGLGEVTEEKAAILQRVHAATQWGRPQKWQHLTKIWCHWALMYRQANNRPPTDVPNSGREILAKLSSLNVPVPTVDVPALVATLDDALRRGTLAARGGAGKQNIHRLLDEAFAKLDQ